MDPSLLAMLAPPKLEDIRCALFIQPHPDDNEIGAGGTMARLVQQGAEVWELTVTDDRYISEVPEGSEFTVRQAEVRAAMEVLGVKNAGFLGFHDKTRASVEEISEAILPVIREIRPDAVFTVDPWLVGECHSDHVKIGQAVCWAVMDSGCDFFPETPDGSRHPDAYPVPMLGLYYTANPNTVVDVSDVIGMKLKSMNAHSSQMYPGFTDMILGLAQMLAEGTGYAFVEKIRMLSAHHLHCFNLPVG
jgi:N,N'-diacetylchitobiose non-reducing end deacetylase